ncbi:MAG: tetratricopeptide repeat-containing glycosyltransferase family protein, partial [Thermodesulfobacteriota bacterium]
MAQKEHPAEDLERRGVAAQRRGDHAAAADLYAQSLDAGGGGAAIYANLGLALLRTGRLAAAAVSLDRAASLDPANPVPLVYLGEARRALQEPLPAARALRAALKLDRGLAYAWLQLGMVLNDQARPAEGLKCLDRALRLKPELSDARWPRILALFRLGRLGEAFAAYEDRFERLDCPARKLPRPAWDGSDPAGRTILLHHEQGLGDTLMFCRYAPLAAERGARVILGCQPELAPLLATLPGVDQVAVPGARLRFDLHAPLLSLPRLFNTDLDTIPSQVPYIQVPDGASSPLRRRHGKGLDVGLVWAGNPRHTGDALRSIPLRELLPLAAVPGVRLHSLQFGERAGDVDRLGCGGLVLPLSSRITSFAESAAALRDLDLLVTVDTAALHLAGALGRPAWGLLSSNPDWRWLPGRADSPWYPTLRLFHQAKPGDWAGVAAQVREELERMARER